MKKILVTGFRPFNGRDINPSMMILESLKDPEGCKLIKLLLPVEYKMSGEILESTVRQEKPDFILSVGQAGNVPHISVEYVAVNLDNSKSSDGEKILPDEAGYAPVCERIDETLPDAYFATLPLWDMVKAINENDIPARISYSAGTFVCNHVMYVACSLRRDYPDMKTGFIHVPFLPEQLKGEENTEGKYAMELSDMIRAIQLVVNMLSVTGGTEEV